MLNAMYDSKQAYLSELVWDIQLHYKSEMENQSTAIVKLCVYAKCDPFSPK